MSWSRRALIAALLVGACGFTPVYGPGGPGQALRGQIAVAPPTDEGAYVLVRQLEDRLGLPTAPLYDLTADIQTDREGLGVTPDQETTRLQIVGIARYRLTDRATGDILSEGQERNFTSYSAPVFAQNRATVAGNTVSIRAAREAARDRLMVILADQIVARLLATAGDWRR